MIRTQSASRRLAAITATCAIAVAAVPASIAALHAAATSTANPKAGKATFASTCAGCHTLKAAGAKGTAGPNLDKTRLSQATVVKAITNGGATVMSKAAVAKYVARMPAFKGTLTPTQITNVAAFVYASTHK